MTKINQTGAGKHGDRRTKRARDRSTKERLAVAEQVDEEEQTEDA